MAFPKMKFNKAFSSVASAVAHAAGMPVTFLACCAIVIIWAVSGPLFGFSDTWQLIINTGTTIITFLMVFLIQNTQNRDGAAVQVKLDELIRASKSENTFIGIEHLTEEEVADFRKRCENAAKAQAIVKRYPEGRQRSAVMPLLDLAQRQIGAETNTQGWLPIPVIEFVACELDMPVIRVLEVENFYTMYNLQPLGKYLIQVCTNISCNLCGGESVLRAFLEQTGTEGGEVSANGLWTVIEVECLGACGFPTVVQINDKFYENVTPENVAEILAGLK